MLLICIQMHSSSLYIPTCTLPPQDENSSSVCNQRVDMQRLQRMLSKEQQELQVSTTITSTYRLLSIVMLFFLLGAFNRDVIYCIYVCIPKPSYGMLCHYPSWKCISCDSSFNRTLLCVGGILCTLDQTFLCYDQSQHMAYFTVHK